MSTRKPPGGVPAAGVSAEISEIVAYIHALRADLTDFGAPLGGQQITDARAELGAVMQTTENAANQIMDACDLLRVATKTSGSDKISQAIDAIYEACSFQDLTSQRVVKVRRTLDMIEQRMCDVAAKLGIDTTIVSAPVVPVVHDEKDESWLLNGPAMPGSGVGQGEVDNFFG
jgi:chemotaxis protein CheZ